jgi:N-acetylglutamate synthase-like GNAT family acetyltransferase
MSNPTDRPFELRRGDYLVTTDASRLDIDVIHRFLSDESYWAAGIPRALVAKSIANSINFGLFDGDRQAGFARAITDRATFAYVADVFVDEAHRGKGLGKLLMEAVTKHPELKALRRLMLGTDSAHGLYEQFGFAALADPGRWMERSNPAAYQVGAP